MNYDDKQLAYIKFILVGDNFDISKLLREKAEDWGMDTLYDFCDIIARAFVNYDTLGECWNYISEYECLTHFLVEYDKELRQMISGEYVDLINLVRSKYE